MKRFLILVSLLLGLSAGIAAVGMKDAVLQTDLDGGNKKMTNVAEADITLLGGPATNQVKTYISQATGNLGSISGRGSNDFETAIHAAATYDTAAHATSEILNVATNIAPLRKVTSPTYTGYAFQNTNGPTHPGPNPLGLLDPQFLSPHTNLAAYIDGFGVFNFYQNPVRAGDNVSFLTTADFSSVSPFVGEIDASGVTGLYSNNITGMINAGQIDPPIVPSATILSVTTNVTIVHVTNQVFNWNTNIGYMTASTVPPEANGQYGRIGGTTTFTNVSVAGNRMFLIASDSSPGAILIASNSVGADWFECNSLDPSDDWNEADGQGPPIFIFATNSISYVLGAVTNMNLGNGAPLSGNGKGLTNMPNTLAESNSFIYNGKVGASVTGIIVNPTATFGGQGTAFDINNSGSVPGIDTFQGIRFKRNGGKPVRITDSTGLNDLLYIGGDSNGRYNLLGIAPIGMLGDVISAQPSGYYPLGAGGETYSPHYLGSGAGLADLPSPADVASASPVPSVAFTTFYVYVTNTSELVVTNLARMMSTNGMLPHMTNLGIPVVVHLDAGWQQTNRDAAGKILPRSGQFPNGMKQTANEVHSFGVGFRPTVYFDTRIPTNGNTLHIGANGAGVTAYPLQPDFIGGGLPILDCSNPNTVEEDMEWFYTNNIDQVRIADGGNNFKEIGMLMQMRQMWDYAAQTPKGGSYRLLANHGMSNAIVIEYLGTENSLTPAVIKLSNIQGTDVLSSGTNASHDLIVQLQKWDASQWPYFGQGNLPELSYSGFVHVMDTNSFKMFQSIAAAVPCHQMITSECITNGYASVYMTNDSVWKEFASPVITSAGVFSLTNGEFFVLPRGLKKGEVVVAVLNKGTVSNAMDVPFASCGLSAIEPYLVYDDWGQTNLGVFTASFPTPMVLNGSAGLFHISRPGAGEASYAPPLRIALAVTAGGITNTSGVNLTVYGFTGTSVTLYDNLTNSLPLGTITSPQTLTLQPRGALAGSSCAAAGVHP